MISLSCSIVRQILFKFPKKEMKVRLQSFNTGRLWRSPTVNAHGTHRLILTVFINLINSIVYNYNMALKKKNNYNVHLWSRISYLDISIVQHLDRCKRGKKNDSVHVSNSSSPLINYTLLSISIETHFSLLLTTHFQLRMVASSSPVGGPL